MHAIETYSLGFFFGPGLPLGLGPSTPAPNALFPGGFGARRVFRLLSSTGGGTLFDPVGAGVVFDSDLTSTGEACSVFGTGVDVDEEGVFGCEGLRVTVS